MHKSLMALLSDGKNNIPCNAELANAFGITGALLIAYFTEKTDIENATGTIIKNGRIWCTETYEHMMHGAFPFLSTRTLERAVKKLEDQGVLLSEFFGNYRMNRTKSYSVNIDRVFEIMEKGSDE